MGGGLLRMIRGGAECTALAAVTLVSASLWPTRAQAQSPATPAATRPGDSAVAFDIAAQPMAAALNAWAVQANAQVFVDPGPVAHLMAPAVKGTLTPRQALRLLLARSKLQVTQGTDGVFVVKPRPSIPVVIGQPPEAPQATAAPVTQTPAEPLTARQSAGPWLVGFGAQFARDSGNASGGAAAAVAGEYFITDQLAAAVSASTPRTHSFDVPATPSASQYRASARLQSTALALKYYFAPESHLDPFLGAGVDLTTLFDASGVAGLDRVTVGPTVEAGVDVLLNAHWLINAGVSWSQVRPEAGGAPGQQIHLDPVQFGLGFVYRFGASDDFLKRR
jgi:outer membrane protein W